METNEPLSLSAAIRLGAMLKPQFRGQFHGENVRLKFSTRFPFIKFEYTQASCAIGAALDAIGGMPVTSFVRPKGSTEAGFRGQVRILKKDEVAYTQQLPPEWLDLMWKESPCPECGESQFVYRLIPHLNDKHSSWTRERIADWVESIERAPARKVEAEVGVSVAR